MHQATNHALLRCVPHLNPLPPSETGDHHYQLNADALVVARKASTIGAPPIGGGADTTGRRKGAKAEVAFCVNLDATSTGAAARAGGRRTTETAASTVRADSRKASPPAGTKGGAMARRVEEQATEITPSCGPTDETALRARTLVKTWTRGVTGNQRLVRWRHLAGRTVSDKDGCQRDPDPGTGTCVERPVAQGGAEAALRAEPMALVTSAHTAVMYK